MVNGDDAIISPDGDGDEGSVIEVVSRAAEVDVVEETETGETSVSVENGQWSCAVCLEEQSSDTPHVQMECCGRPGATTLYCSPCVRVICRMMGGIGRCPSCRGFISITPDGRRAVVTERRGRCTICCQEPRTIVSDQLGGLCEKCLLGQQYAFPYICNGCGGTQRIRHPMWLYQPRPDVFGTATWACHLGCGNYTLWKIHPDHVAKVPHAHLPESWGARDEWLAEVRRLRTAEQLAGRREEDRNSTPNTPGNECILL